MSMSAPPLPPQVTDPDVEALEALIEEARKRARRRRRRYTGAMLFALLAGVGAAYLGLAHGWPGDGGEGTAPTRSPASGSRSGVHGPITILTMGQPHGAGDPQGVARVEAIDSTGPKTLWSCPRAVWCGQIVSSDWAPDGRRLALTLDSIGGTSGYVVGLHVIDVVSGREIRIPSGPPADLRAEEWSLYRRSLLARLGCSPPSDLDWSPDGRKLAYRCSGGVARPWRRHELTVIDIEGDGYTVVPTQAPAFWPSWSPDGKRIAFSTTQLPDAKSSIYTVALDGSDRRLVASGGSAPAWSPDGKTIVYQTTCGLRLVTPAGREVTSGRSSEGCGIGFSGRPTWAPDGSKIAFEATGGIWVMNEDGSELRRVSRRTSRAWYGSQPGRPSWRPLPIPYRRP
jgi:hypothetical protein